MNIDKLNKLQQIAEGTVHTGKANHKRFSDIRADQTKNKLEKIEASIKQMYPNNKQELFNTWVQATKELPLPTDKIKEQYWKKYLELHPDGESKAREELISRTEMEMEMFQSPTEKEHFLRDKVSKWPNWMVEEFKDDLQNFSTRNADINLNKAKQVYKDDLSRRLSKISDKELDPDVPEDAHVEDLLKLERMNLLDVSNTINGRFGVANKDGMFTPAFDLEDRAQIFPQDPYGTPNTDEQLMVDELAPEFIKNYVKGNVSKQRAKINLDNKASEGVAANMLETGSLTPDKWNEAFSMFAKPEYQTLIERGMMGEINSGRVKNEKDIMKTLYMALNQYKDLFQGDVNAPNTK